MEPMGAFELASDDEIVREAPAGKEARPRADRDVGNALRSVYVETVNEDVPPELLDLLGKLG